MKSYREFVSQYEVGFGTLIKVAQDLASLLDDNCLVAPKPEERNFSDTEILLTRIRVLENLRSICTQREIVPPPMEQDLFLRLVPTGLYDKELMKFVESVRIGTQIKIVKLPEGENKTRIIQLLQVIDLMPTMLSEFRGPNLYQTMALLNTLLMGMGIEPLPMHEPSKFTFALNIPAPNRKLRLLIVDDESLEIAKSYFALVGCPNTIIESFRVERENLRDPVEIEERLKFIAQDILKCKPDIVLMDQGMPPFSGSGLIGAIHDVAVNRDVFFVGNTGGSPYELEQAGAHGNFEKGRRKQCILSAFSHFL